MNANIKAEHEDAFFGREHSGYFAPWVYKRQRSQCPGPKDCEERQTEMRHRALQTYK